MTKPDMQKTFDTVARHLLRQGRKAKAGSSCLYRAPNGDKCAVGCLIPDELYKDTMEGSLVDDLLEDFTELRQVPLINGFDRLLYQLQHVHDDWDVGDWRWQLGEVADRFKLDKEVLK